jgi:hypothetical protein
MTTTGEKKTIWQRLDNLDYRIIYIIYVVVLAVFVITPIGLPVPITQQTKNAYNFVENDLHPGDIVVIDTQWGRGSLSTEPGGLAICGHLLKKGVKLICTGTTSSANPYPMDSLKAYVGKMIQKGLLPAGLEYGKDWVYIAPLGLGEIPKQSFAMDIKGKGTDFYGTPLDEFAMLDGVNTVDDIAALYFIGNGVHIEWVRQWSVPYNIPTVTLTLGGNVPQYQPYYPSYLVAVMADIRSAAEYEAMTKFYGVATASMDALSSAILTTFGLVVIGNVAYVINKRTERSG